MECHSVIIGLVIRFTKYEHEYGDDAHRMDVLKGRNYLKINVFCALRHYSYNNGTFLVGMNVCQTAKMQILPALTRS